MESNALLFGGKDTGCHPAVMMKGRGGSGVRLQHGAQWPAASTGGGPSTACAAVHERLSHRGSPSSHTHNGKDTGEKVGPQRQTDRCVMLRLNHGAISPRLCEAKLLPTLASFRGDRAALSLMPSRCSHTCFFFPPFSSLIIAASIWGAMQQKRGLKWQ